MEQFPNHELQYVVDEYYDATDFEDDNNSPRSGSSSMDEDSMDSDFEDDLELSKPRTDTSALEAMNGKDIQGIPWERLNFTREKYRESRLKQYKNYENLSGSRQDLQETIYDERKCSKSFNIKRDNASFPDYEVDLRCKIDCLEYKFRCRLGIGNERIMKPHHRKCKEVEKGQSFYDFQFNTRLVKSTIVHFQLRNLLWATSKHDVYLPQNYSVMHWSSLLRRGKEVLNVAKPVVPTLKYPGCLAQTISRVQISTMTVKDNLMVAGGFHGELICKYLNQPGVAFCTKLAVDENAITNSVDIYHNPSGSMRVIAANNDAEVRVLDTANFACLNNFTFPWSVNNTTVSPDGKLLAVLGDSTECLIADPQSGKVLSSLMGHLDYSFASAWHPNGRILATGNQDTTCRLWDMRNLKESLAILNGRMGAIRAIKFTSDGRFMAMAEPADFVHVFDTLSDYTTGQEIDLFGEIGGISFSPDTDALFVGVSDRTYGCLLEFNRRRNDHYLDCIF